MKPRTKLGNIETNIMSRYLRSCADQDEGCGGPVCDESCYAVSGIGGFCLFIALLTLLCGCCERKKEKKCQYYWGSVLCFVVSVALIMVGLVVLRY